jgi:hypothetical protein
MARLRLLGAHILQNSVSTAIIRSVLIELFSTSSSVVITGAGIVGASRAAMERTAPALQIAK